ncbi:hypothetical protein [Enterovibrio norvegicus]|uniref:hypothetical protein n=1 Tax=Enterovibrio norvegicus TaxID=188144 RepID=UPI000C8268DF|nr:hypothetical protein [Enterovibrio norvegicus]PMN71115.1 hypothetical protein BCT27_17510 [Enterovibrio norvegicus]
MRTKLFIFSSFLTVLVSSQAVAYDYVPFPNTAILHDQSKAKNSIYANCTKNSQNELSCNFVQMTLSYELDPEDLKTTLSNEIDEFLNSNSATRDEKIKEAKSLCSSLSEDNKRVRNHFENLRETSQKDFAIGVIGILDKACEVKTESDANALFIQLTNIQRTFDTQKCKIWPNTWQENFTWKTSSANEYWVTQSSISGECGIINVSTLRQEKPSLWSYESKKIVTNPTGSEGSLKCSDIEERNVSYSWKRQDHIVDCRSIKFGF